MDGDTEELVPLEPLAAKWEAFGWEALSCDGHNLIALGGALERALAPDRARPAVVLARTVKGKGVDFMENAARWHYGSLDSVMYERALASVRRSAP